MRVAIGPLIVLAGMLPLWTFFFIDDDLQGSRYVYLPLVGWVLFLADLIAGYRVVWARRAIAAMVAVLVIGSGWAVRAHMRPWIEAAQVRDVVLRRAAARLAERPCDYPEFTNLPDSVKGAFVFRNGFPEAAHLPRRPATVAMTCVFTWRNGDFVRTN